MLLLRGLFTLTLPCEVNKFEYQKPDTPPPPLIVYPQVNYVTLSWVIIYKVFETDGHIQVITVLFFHQTCMYFASMVFIHRQA